MGKRDLDQFQSPTCQMEILATPSPLSRWAGRRLLRQLRFQIQLSGFSTEGAKTITLRGDRRQLEALYQAIDSYVQQFLVQEFLSDSAQGSAQGAVDPAQREIALTSAKPDQLNQAMPSEFHRSDPLDSAAAVAEGDREGIYLTAQTWLTHTLHLGSLTTAAAGTHLKLSTLQLSDLTAILEDYRSRYDALPFPSSASGLRQPPFWANIAAATLITVGLGSLLTQFIPVPGGNVATTSSESASQKSGSTSQSNIPLVPVPQSPPLQGTPLPPPLSPNGDPQASPSATPPNPRGIPGQIPITPVPQGEALPLPPPPAVDGTDTLPERQPVPPPAAPRIASQPTRESAPTSGMAQGAPATRRSVNPGPTTLGDRVQSQSAVDPLTQASAVLGYFQQRWQPPANLTEVLSYRLTLAANGSLQRFVPLNNAAANFLDRTPIPLAGEVFVPPTAPGTPPQSLTLELRPDGSVVVFQE